MRKLLSIFLMLVSFSFFSCRTTIKEQSCDKCSLRPPDASASLRIAEKDLKFSVWNRAKSDYAFGSADNEDKALLSKYLNSDLHITEKGVTVALVIYIEGPINDGPVAKTTIRGVSRYYVLNHTIYHQLLVQKDGRFINVPLLEKSTPAFVTTDAFDISELYFGSGKMNALFIPTKDLFSNGNSTPDELAPVLSTMRSQSVRLNKTALVPGSNNGGTGIRNCGDPCIMASNRGCAWIITGYQCGFTFPGPCRSTDMRTVSIDQGHLNNGNAGTVYDMPLQRTFRDSLLAYSSLGRRYIAYYYSLDSIYTSNSSILIQNISVLPRVNSAMQKLMQPITHSTDILIDGSIESDLLALADSYISIAPDRVQLKIFNDFKADVSHFANRTVMDVYTEL